MLSSCRSWTTLHILNNSECKREDIKDYRKRRLCAFPLPISSNFRFLQAKIWNLRRKSNVAEEQRKK